MALFLIVGMIIYIFMILIVLVVFTQTWKDLSHFGHSSVVKIQAICIRNGIQSTHVISLTLNVWNHKLWSHAHGSPWIMSNWWYRRFRNSELSLKIKCPFLLFRSSLWVIDFCGRRIRLWTKHNLFIRALISLIWISYAIIGVVLFDDYIDVLNFL